MKKLLYIWILFFSTLVFASNPTEFKEISSGRTHTVGIKYDGTLWGWGNNGNGQLGDGTNTSKLSPTQIGTDANWTTISAGSYHTVAIKSDGTLWSWGGNWNGQLGDGTTTNNSSPTQIGAATNWVKISAGDSHTVAIKSDGTLWAWGWNVTGQLGDGTTTSKLSPTQIGVATDWATVSAGFFHTVATKSDGTLWAWGSNWVGQLGDGTTLGKSSPTRVGTATNWATISAGVYHTVAINSDGTLFSWGENELGQLGDGTTTYKSSPTQIGAVAEWRTFSTYYSHTVAIKSDGTLWAWGGNGFGQLGDGTTTNKSSPTKIGTAADWTKISAGSDFTVAIKSDGTFWTWGGNGYGQLGDGTTSSKSSPTQIGTAAEFATISAGSRHNIAIKSDGTLWAWGWNGNSQLGDDTTGDRSSPTQVGTAADWAKISAGSSHTVAIKSDGTLWAWGYGQLGDGTTSKKSSPTQMDSDTNWTTISAGDNHTVAIKKDGTLWAWGENSLGQLGDGTTTNKSTPTKIGTAAEWAAVSAGSYHTVAIKSDGTLFTWGGNSVGQLGDGNTTNNSSPTQIGATAEWAKFSTGDNHTVAIKSDGTLWAWGSNVTGQLGDGTTTNKSSPTLVGTATNWATVSAGTYHTAAINSDKKLFAWGGNWVGQLGDGTTTNKSTPTQIGTATEWATVSAGGYHTAAIKSDGTLFTWGANWHGQLGTGSTLLPQLIHLPLVITGTLGDDILIGSDGNNIIDGLAGMMDRLVYDGNKTSYTVTHNANGSYTITKPNGTDTVTNVEYLSFNDEPMVPIYSLLPPPPCAWVGSECMPITQTLAFPAVALPVAAIIEGSHVFSFTLSSAQNVAIFTRDGSGAVGDIDTFGVLYDSNGTFIAQNNDAADGGGNFKILTNLNAGTYTLVVTGFDGGAVPLYQLNILNNDDGQYGTELPVNIDNFWNEENASVYGSVSSETLAQGTTFYMAEPGQTDTLQMVKYTLDMNNSLLHRTSYPSGTLLSSDVVTIANNEINITSSNQSFKIDATSLDYNATTLSSFFTFVNPASQGAWIHYNYSNQYYYSIVSFNQSAADELLGITASLNPKMAKLLNHGYTYVSLPSSKTLCAANVQQTMQNCDQNNTLESVFGANSNIELVFKFGREWMYWENNATANPAYSMQKFATINPLEGIMVKTSAATIIHLPFDASSTIVNDYANLFPAGWTLMSNNQEQTVAQITTALGLKNKALVYIMLLRDDGWHVYPENAAVTPSLPMDSNSSVNKYESYWVYFIPNSG